MSQQTFELTMGERLRVLRHRSGLSQDEAAIEAQKRLPLSLSMSRELLRRLEIGAIQEDRANPVHVAALAGVYGARVGDISPAAADALGSVDLLIRSTGCLIAA